MHVYHLKICSKVCDWYEFVYVPAVSGYDLMFVSVADSSQQ